MPVENLEKPQSIANQQNPFLSNMALNIPLTYANGALLALSAADIQITLTFNGRPASSIAMPLSCAKSLNKSLEKAITDYERKTGTTVIDLAEASELIKKP